MIAVACARDMLERRRIAGDRPRLSQRDAASAWHLAGQTVHAAVKVIRDTAPSPKAGLHLAVTPICAGLGPFDSNAAATGEARVGDNPEVAPKAVEDRPMLADLSPRSGPSIPVHTLVRGSPGARYTTIQEDRDAWC